MRGAVPRGWRWPHARWFTSVLVVTWLVCILANVHAAPRRGYLPELRQAVAQQRVVAVQTAAEPPGLFRQLVDNQPATAPGDGAFVWTLDDGTRRWIETTGLWELELRVHVPQQPDGTYRDEDGTRALIDTVTAWAHPQGAPSDWPGLVPWLRWLLWAEAIALVVGRRPATGTRWFWFWIIALPAGVGVLWFSLAEVLGWADVRPSRRTGLRGFVLLLLANLVTLHPGVRLP